MPLRKIYEALGANVAWNGNTRTITVTENGHITVFKLGSREAVRDNQAVSLDVPVRIQGNQTVVPINIVEETMQVDIQWDEKSKSFVTINK